MPALAPLPIVFPAFMNPLPSVATRHDPSLPLDKPRPAQAQPHRAQSHMDWSAVATTTILPALGDQNRGRLPSCHRTHFAGYELIDYFCSLPVIPGVGVQS